ncbi:type II secretion system protein [bacterium]|nr:type II secretion system protein [bacterium]
MFSIKNKLLPTPPYEKDINKNIISLLGENRISMFNLLNIRNSKRGYLFLDADAPSPSISLRRRGKKCAFTLAEVLITLVIIGVIAAITVPTLMNNTNKQEYVSKLKKAYSTLSQATNLIIAEEGTPRADKGGWASSHENMFNLYKKHLINAKECGSDTGCFGQGKYTKLDGSEWSLVVDDFVTGKLILADGTQVDIESFSNDCSRSVHGSNNVCGLILVDINGERKPNDIGKDAFLFALKENGLYPVGCDDSTHCASNREGWGCTCKVLREGAINY